MKTLSLILITALSATLIISGCNKDSDNLKIYKSDLEYPSIKDLNEFYEGGFNVIDGNVIIRNLDDLTEMQALSNVDSITGMLNIGVNSNLASLNGLNRLKSVGKLVIRENSSLINLSGLDNLQSSKNGLSVRLNNELSSLEGLQNLKLVLGDIWIEQNPKLSSLEELSNLNSEIRGIYIRSLDKLTNLNGLENIEFIVNEVNINNNKNLTNLEGLNNLQSIGSRISISDNQTLTNLDALINLRYVKYEFNVDNNFLSNLNGLDSLQYVGTLKIRYNTILTDFCSIKNLLTIDGVKLNTIIEENQYNPTVNDIINDNCSQ